MRDDIRRIVNVGTGSWDSVDDIWVFYEGDTREPEQFIGDDAAEQWYSYLESQGIDMDSDDAIADVIDAGLEDGTLDLVDSENVAEMNALDADISEARERAAGIGTVPPVVPTPIPTPGGDDDVDDYEPELVDEVAVKKHTGRKVVAGALAGAALLGAGYTLGQVLNNQSEVTVDVDDDDDLDLDQDNNANTDIDFDTATFDELMESMSEDDARRVVSETAMELVETFNEQTHKADNFRLEEDEDTYLDLSFEEALVLTAFTNYSDDAETLADIFGTYGLTSTDAEDILESARTKLITYYMNAKEPSGLANIFFNEEDRAFFENFESEVIEFNTEHTTDKSDKVIRDVYYNYILDGATNYTDVSSFAKLLAFDAVYGGLNLVESASTEHTQYLVFHGEGEEAETKYYVENILGLDYDSMSDEEKESYRENIIESGTELVNLLSSGEVMTEDNSTQEELDAEYSITELVDRMGLCNSVNSEIEEALQNMTTYLANRSTNVTSLNVSLSDTLRELGLDDLASEVDASIDSTLSEDLLSRISAANADAAEAVETYNTRIGAVNDTNRPSMEQIIRAANEYTATLENYAGDSKDVATLINNRRHTTEYNYTADESGLIGYDEGIPVYDSSVIEGMSDEELEDFIIENGTVIDEKTETVTEEVSYDDLTEEQKEEVEEQKAIIEASLAKDNADAAGQISANSYANASTYNFSPSTVTNDANGEVYDLNSMSFANGVAYAYAFGGTTVSASDSQIQEAAEAAAESYLNSISSEDQAAIAEGMGVSWSEARAQLKSAYLSGYTSQMETEISTAISVGKEMRATTDAILAEIAELNENQETSTEDNTVEESVTEEVEETVTQTDESTDANEEETEITEGEVTVDDSSTDTSTDTTTDEDVNANVDEDDYDPNIGEQFQEGEELIEDADGNSVREEEEVVESTAVEYSSTSDSSTSANIEEEETVATPTEVTVEEEVVVETPSVSEETTDDVIADVFESVMEEDTDDLTVETPKTR